ncbi:shTK domain protein [Trichuris suis]|nr:shTK domain protein [Trichuris suis]
MDAHKENRCKDYSAQCIDWASGGQCEVSDWVQKNCKFSCRKCYGFLPKPPPEQYPMDRSQPKRILLCCLLMRLFTIVDYDRHSAPPDLKPIAFLVGRWRSEFGGKAKFPTIPNFTYGEQLDYRISDNPLFGLPSLNYRQSILLLSYQYDE